MEDIPIEGVVEGFEGPSEILSVSGGAGDEVGEAWDGIGGGGGDGELGFYKNWVLGWWRLRRRGGGEKERGRRRREGGGDEER